MGPFFATLILSDEFFLTFVFFFNVLNKLSEYIYFYISKNITLYTFLLLFKIVKSFSVSLSEVSFVFLFIFFRLQMFFGPVRGAEKVSVELDIMGSYKP